MQVKLLVGRDSGSVVDMPYDIAKANVAIGAAAWHEGPVALATPTPQPEIQAPAAIPIIPEAVKTAPAARPRQGRGRK